MVYQWSAVIGKTSVCMHSPRLCIERLTQVSLDVGRSANDFDPRFKIFHELMQHKVQNILLVSCLYDACIMDEDGRLAEKIVNEYRGLNLSQPPRLTWVSSATEALNALSSQKYDMVLTMLRLAEMDAYALGQQIKKRDPGLAVILLSHAAPDPRHICQTASSCNIDRTFVWTGNADLLVAIIKSVEDGFNVAHDTQVAKVRVILFVEDSPTYLSSLLPILYTEVVLQTQAVMEQGLNEEHRLLTMRARPKILVAENYEEATAIYEQFKEFIIGVISDARFPVQGQLDETAGIRFLSRVKSERHDISVLLTSSEAYNASKAPSIPALFLDKNSSSLHADVRSFLMEHLGFGEFVFRMPDGQEIARTSSMYAFEKILPTVPAESFYYHWSQNDFSRWFFAHAEIILASKLRPATDADFECDLESMREFIITTIRARRLRLQRGVLASLGSRDFDPETEFFKIGKGSLGGKARGLVFISNLLNRHDDLSAKFSQAMKIVFPPSLMLTTEVFDSFIRLNNLRRFAETDALDETIADAFLKARLPEWVHEKLAIYLSQIKYPLAVRSSSLLEDSYSCPYSGLYKTYMLPNHHQDLEPRLQQLIVAVKMIYASTYFQGPKAYARMTAQRTEEEKMAIIIQKLVGEQYGNYFYPAISGVAQCYNYYPASSRMMDEGIAHIAMGLGKIVTEGGKVLRFYPKHPRVLPQFSTAEDTLTNSQQYYYCLNMVNEEVKLAINDDSTLEKRDVACAERKGPVQILASTYIPQEHRIEDSGVGLGPKVLTFNQILKDNSFSLPEMLSELLELGKEGMGCPVGIEFAVDLCSRRNCKPELAPLQIRPLANEMQTAEVQIADEEIARAFCFSCHALGNGRRLGMTDILYVKPNASNGTDTPQIVGEIGEINSRLSQQGRHYLLVGPERWGSTDPWLGIPVHWEDISGVRAIVETISGKRQDEPPQGVHFFHNIAMLGVYYATITANGIDFMDWRWLRSQTIRDETPHLVHAETERSFGVKADGHTMRCVMFC